MDPRTLIIFESFLNNVEVFNRERNSLPTLRGGRDGVTSSLPCPPPLPRGTAFFLVFMPSSFSHSVSARPSLVSNSHLLGRLTLLGVRQVGLGWLQFSAIPLIAQPYVATESVGNDSNGVSWSIFLTLLTNTECVSVVRLRTSRTPPR